MLKDCKTGVSILEQQQLGNSIDYLLKFVMLETINNKLMILLWLQEGIRRHSVAFASEEINFFKTAWWELLQNQETCPITLKWHLTTGWRPDQT